MINTTWTEQASQRGTAINEAVPAMLASDCDVGPNEERPIPRVALPAGKYPDGPSVADEIMRQHLREGGSPCS